MEITEQIHIGNLIHKELNRQERSLAWLARQIGCDRGNLHRKLCNAQISNTLLKKISIALKTDFFACYSAFIQSKIDV